MQTLLASWWGRSTAREGLGTEQPAPGTTLSRTCEAKAPGITRAWSGGAGAAMPAQTPRSLSRADLSGKGFRSVYACVVSDCGVHWASER